MLEFRVLGPLEVVDENGPIRLAGTRQRATLAILLLNANRVVSVDRLAEELYGGAPPVTAVTQVQRQISELRKLLGSVSVIETRPPGYLIHLAPEQLDLHLFEQRAEEAVEALTRGQAQLAADLLGQALGLWRGTPLADLAYEPFAQTSIERLEEMRLAALEQRVEVDLSLGRHNELVGELEEVVAEHPFRERLRGQLMLALYRSGRQTDALDVYRRMREKLAEEFGIEPGPALHELQRAILNQDRSLDFESPASARANSTVETDRRLLVLSQKTEGLQGLLSIAEPLAGLPARELLIVRVLTDGSELGEAAAAVRARHSSLKVRARIAVFTTSDVGRDVARLASRYDVELALLDAPVGLDAETMPGGLAGVLERSPCDVGVLAGSAIELGQGAGVFVPFGGGEHDWAALELGAWLAVAAHAPLRVVGTEADPRQGQRDASRLLADASLAVQRVIGVEAEPVLAEPAEEALLAAVEPAFVVIVGISPRWRSEGIGTARRALVRRARPPTLLVHRGPRPGGLAPRGSRTRFTWSIEG